MRGSCARDGFTLVELMVVVAIIGILAAMVVPNFTSQVEKARVTRALAELASIKTIIDLNYLEHSKYPDGGTDLQDILQENGINWTENGIHDPWGNNYSYTKKNDKSYQINSGKYGKSLNKYVFATESKEPTISDEPNESGV